MAKTKTRKRRTPVEVAEDRARTLRARLESEQLKSMLAYYKAADRGRQNRDWRPQAASADLALIPEQGTIVARSRLAIANTWVGKAALRAQKRNVVGRGIEVVPTASGTDGAELSELNSAMAREYIGWASDSSAVDVEGRRTFWQLQRSIVAEEFAAGAAFVVWSYTPHARRVGLQLQIVEVEQLDLSIQTCGDNEVRGGIEVNDNGRPVAYHFCRRPPNDYLTSSYDTIRIPAERVLHYYDAERAQQTHGEPRLAPVLQDIRSLYALHEAALWRARMEACVGLVITRNLPTGAGFGPTTPYGVGAGGSTPAGTRTADFRPGMLFEAQPGESVANTGMVTPGNTYAPFTEMTLRGIGAGIGMSFGALTRHNDANYSAARQDMLEDEREIAPQQDLLIDRIILPVWELFVSIAVTEGKLPIDAGEFASDPGRFMEAEFVTPVRPWIDPEKEANAYEKALRLHITTRAEIVAQRGGRLQTVLAQRKAERDAAKKLEITFAEEAEITSVRSGSAAQFAKADVDRATAESTRKEVEPPAEGSASGGDAAIETKIEASSPTGAPLNGAQISAAVDVVANVRQNIIPIEAAKELLLAVGIPPAAADRMVNEISEEPKLDDNEAEEIVKQMMAGGASRAVSLEHAAKIEAAKEASVPNYRRMSLPQSSCATCSESVGMACKRFDFTVLSDHVCDAWAARPINESDDGGSKPMGLPRRDGDRAFDDTSSRDRLSADENWRTINGTPVKIEGGEIASGPPNLKGKKFTPGKTPPKQKSGSTRADRAKSSHNYTGVDRQRHAKENERVLAKSLGGGAYDDSEPVDVTVPDKSGRIAHGLELKTVTSNKAAKLTMDSYSQLRKAEWSRANNADYHTVAIIGDAKDERFYYRRGIAGSARLGSMHEVKGVRNLKKLMETPDDALPAAARRTDVRVTDPAWKRVEGERAFRHKKTGEIVRAKK